MKGKYRQDVTLAPPGELRAYVVFEHQLDSIAQGSPAALLLNFALFFLGVAATALGTLIALPAGQDKSYYTFLIIFLVTLIAGVVLLALWWFIHRSAATILAEIKAQMPANPAVEQLPADDAAPGDTELRASQGS